MQRVSFQLQAAEISVRVVILADFILILILFCSCYAHVVALAERAFLTSLSVKSKKAAKNDNTGVTAMDIDEVGTPDVDVTQNQSLDEELQIDESEETEEEVAELMEELESTALETVDDLVELKTILLNVRRFVAKQRRSPLAKHYFLACCRTVNIPECELLPFCATRWSSMLTVIERLILLEKAVKYFMNTADDCSELPKPPKGQQTFGDYKLSTRQWELLVIVWDVLLVCIHPQIIFSN